MNLSELNATTPMDAALAYARLGWSVFPVAPLDRRTGHCGCRDGADCEQIGKHPLVRWGDKATTDQDEIRNWWRWKPHANIGVATGQRSGLVVIDIDRHHDGLQTRQQLAEQGFTFPPTQAARTRSGGWHFFYNSPGRDRRVPNTEGEIAGVGKAHGIDVRGDGGYIIVSPSVRPNSIGENGRPMLGRYLWVNRDRPITDAPEWVTAPKPTPVHHVSPRPHFPGENRDLEARAEAALQGEITRVHHAGEGERNRALFFAAANLFEICNTGWLNEQQVRSELTAAAGAVGLGEREIRQTLDAQWRRKTGVRRQGWDDHSPGQPLATPSAGFAPRL